MYQGKKIISLIPARGGSKGVLRKNIKMFCGKPLIYYSIIDSLNSEYIDETWVSTEDKEIKELSLQYGAKVLDRPEELATDTATAKDVLIHAVNNINSDIIMLLNPTSPIRIFNLIDRVIEKFDPYKFDTLATGYMCRNHEWAKYEDNNRQFLKAWFYDGATIYLHKAFYLKQGHYWCPDSKRRKSLTIPEFYNYEIDNIYDFVMLEALFNYLLKQGADSFNVQF